jgi:non-ribosomal peptide synthetase-like protein
VSQIAQVAEPSASAGATPSLRSRAAPGRVRRLHHVFERAADRWPTAVALECHGAVLTYAQLEARANRLANHLLGHGLPIGGRVGLLLERSEALYAALLAVPKAGATFVPIDPAVPPDRFAFIAEDARLDTVLTTSEFTDTFDGLAVPHIDLDRVASQVAAAPPGRPTVPLDGDPLCYIIYTSGSTGRPKGVEVPHSCVCSLLGVVPELYGVTHSDRVYQGMTISFDFSIEEIWPTWAVGATLVAGPIDGRNVGPPLADFLEDAAITMLYCVPTVLATLDRTLPSIRTVNVGGEACPAELVERWGGSGRRMLNTYGPTETTVTCTMAELSPGRPVTIGRPLRGTTIVMLDEHLGPVPLGEVGEICVGGPGVARGYVNRDDLTAERFIDAPQDLAPGRLYRTGDFGRLLANGEIEYLGRSDSEVKVRGHRVDLQEIESLLQAEKHVTAAVVTLLDTAAGGELAGYLLLAEQAPAFGELARRLHATLRRRLPPYMVPAYLEEVASIPMLASGKADRTSLPAPTAPRLLGGDVVYLPPTTPTEHQVVAVWEAVLGLSAGTLSVEANLFDDAGGHSLIAATIVSRLRSVEGGAELSILDLYANPTVRTFAEYLDLQVLERTASAGPAEAPPPRPDPPTRLRVAAFTAAQALWVYALLFVFVLPLGVVYGINRGEPSIVMLQQLLLSFPVSYLAGRWVMPLVGTRLCSRGLREGVHPLWGWTHLRVWAVQKALALSPLPRLAGSPWMAAYLRLAGAAVGDAAHVGSAQIPLPRFVELGDDVTVGYAARLVAAEIVDGRLHIGTVRVGDGAVVRANAVVQGPCSLGAAALLAEQSLLRPGQHIPAGTSWSGSPAAPRPGVGDPVVEVMAACPLAPRQWPRTMLPSFAVGVLALELLPLVALVPVIAVVWWALLAVDVWAALVATAASGPVFVVSACGLILLVRRFALLATPVGIHHLRSQLGLEKWFGDQVLELSLELTNSMWATLYTPHWLRLLGATVGRGAEVSTIANIDPDLLTLEDECFVADMASVGSATYCNGHVAFRQTEVGARAFVGNASFVPSGTHLGDGSLIGVQSVPPVSGVAPGTSWLGSPPIYLPRRELYEGFTEGETFRPSRRKVLARYVIEFFRTVLPASILGLSTFGTLYALHLVAQRTSIPTVVLLTPVIALAASLLVVLVVAGIKWCLIGRYRPRVEPLWSGFVRRTEFVTGIYEGAAVPVLLATLTGTPLLGALLRLFGAKVGRRTLIDTTYLTEFDLLEIGDDVAVGRDASLQTHLFEDRVMKLGTVTLEPGATIGERAVVLYGATVSTRASLAALSLVMKGERLPPETSWAGVPAEPARRSLHLAQVPVAAVDRVSTAGAWASSRTSAPSDQPTASQLAWFRPAARAAPCLRPMVVPRRRHRRRPPVRHPFVCGWSPLAPAHREVGPRIVAIPPARAGTGQDPSILPNLFGRRLDAQAGYEERWEDLFDERAFDWFD